MSTVPPMESLSGGERGSDVENSALGMFILTFRIFGKKLIGCSLPGLWLGFKRRVQLKGRLLGPASNETITSCCESLTIAGREWVVKQNIPQRIMGAARHPAVAARAQRAAPDPVPSGAKI
ncbi:hypothetical protein [Burkholderia metallica]|nr:hypothetical protein [Burkholderia metallica]